MAKRRINFFKVDMTRLETSNNSIVPIEHHSAFAMQIFPYINQLPFDRQTLNSRYMNLSEGNETSMYVDSITDEYIEGKMVICRRKYLPDVEEQGTLSPLDIPLTAGLAEITHFVYYFNTKIIGIEFNFFGPRSSLISDYIVKKCNDTVTQFIINPVIREDIDRALLTNEVAMFQVEAHRNAGNVINELNASLGAAFNAASSAATSETIEIILKKKPYVRKGFLPFLNVDNLIRIFRRDGNREMFNKLRVTVLDENNGNRLRPVDLLADKLAVYKDVDFESERSKRINSGSMFIAINEAYNENRNQLVIE